MNRNNPHYIRCYEALKEASIFKNLEAETIHSILDLMNKEEWKPKTIKNSLEISKTMHFIISGRLKIYQINEQTGREHTIFILSKGDIFDIFNLLDTEEHDVNWEVLDGLELLSFSNLEMRNLILKLPVLNQAIYKYLAKRMRMLEDIATDASIHDTLTRLAKLLLRNINGKSKQLELINNLPNDEIANLIGTTRAVVNRHLQELKKAGAIELKRKEIEIKNLQLLLNIAEKTISN